ncbi:MAG: flagellar hook-associated protein 3 [Gammaproteobacteria bacterium HGW-Gammaproteobacteria-13]|uniref:flagellar hook-associated protein 3 n=1 Tax=unclassified Pseudomonas TaxID=196821 RepID=UPI000CAFCBF4|nr:MULTISPECIES: flagellar hook-associated protein 3 [unclassified Pseudomonas]MDF3194586.1 flagellar hook-associated protein 3 [Pseudomonas sp. 1928-m]MDP2745276.1 flagellar hook-associated protein 3 [Pseudomonas sp.]PKM27081.1 MAG: flagellar hook-associated protein 3 [Gammaproteobacteria bacterium HGW-Gammaproteobacteria-13]
MVMRISSIQAFNNGVSGLGRNYANLIRTQEQISSGNRILTPADDPVASVRLLQLEQQQALLGQYKENLTAAKNSLTQEETTIKSVVNVLQRIRELAVQAGGGALSADDRKSIAKELSEREGELLNLMNSRNARGEYLFSGFLGKTEPFLRNPDGTYSYQGDEGQRSLQVAGSSSVAINDNGKRLFEDVSNANRIINALGVNNAALPTPPLPATNIPALPAADQRVFMSPGLVQDNQTFNSSFRAGEPYSLAFVSGKEFRIYDSAGADVTSEVPGGGLIDPLVSGGNTINFRGMRFQLDVVLQPGDNELDLDNLLADTATPGTPGINTHSFTLQSAPTDFAVNRSSTNNSAAIVAPAGISNQATFDSQFPTSGVVLRFTDDTNYEVYSQPVGPGSPVLATGTVAGPYPATFSVFGADFTLSAPAAVAGGDEFGLQPQFQEQRSILNTISRLRQALESSPTSPAGNLGVRNEVAIALTNLDSGMGKVLEVQTEIGARMNLIETTEIDNEDVTLVNKSVQADLRELDYAEALSRLSFQTIILEAAQQSYVKIAGLNLFNQLR